MNTSRIDLDAASALTSISRRGSNESAPPSRNGTDAISSSTRSASGRDSPIEQELADDCVARES